ncbi:MAG: FAD-dependent monooxygenase [Pseudomonadota bacterium]
MQTQVLIIGAGPVGMISALCLANAGIDCILLDRHLNRLDAPKAHAINPRSLEICERLGLDADQIREQGASLKDGGMVHFMDTLSGACFGGLPYERQDDGALEFTPWPLVNIPQPIFEQRLEEAVSAHTGITLLRGITALQTHDDSQQVTVDVLGADFKYIQASYVIAADGAGSRIRDGLDIGMTGPEALQHFMMIHFEADLRNLTNLHPGLLYFCLSPDAQGTFIGYQRESTWVFMQSYDPANQSGDDFDEGTCKHLIRQAAGSDLPDLSIKNVSPWAMSAQVADRYRCGRVFLAGDAAHRFPPTGGLGLNTGIADAENLAWKLAHVLNRKADEHLLDSYESERRPIAQLNSQQSLTNSAKMLFLFAAVHGNEPANVSDHYAAACANPDEFPAIAEAVEIQRPHFDSFNLQIGYRYGVEVDAESLDISRYLPSFEPGNFLPLTKLEKSPWLLGKLSQHDFSLLTGPAGQAWRADVYTTLVEDEDFDPIRPFYEQAGLSQSGAILIRPDGHIVERWQSLPDHPQRAVNSAITNVLGNAGTPEH